MKRYKLQAAGMKPIWMQSWRQDYHGVILLKDKTKKNTFSVLNLCLTIIDKYQCVQTDLIN